MVHTLASISAIVTGERQAAENRPLDPAASGVLTVDLDAIVANWRKLEKRGVPAECAGVVKANAYGCGIEPVVRALSVAGCKTFFVATLDEARRARAAAPFATIYVLNGYFAGTGAIFAELNCRPVIGDLAELAEWDAFCKVNGHSGGAAIHIDTGMNRLGISIAEAQALWPRAAQPDHGITLVMSHLACAEDLHHPLNARQVAAFREVARLFTNIPASMANSSGLFLGPQFQFDLVRPGAALYGVNPTPESDNPMQPVIDVKARVVQVRNVEKGETVGYGATWTARRPTRLALVAAGYADGYFRAAGGVDGVRTADAVVAGVRCPIAGRISMDLMAIDITDLPSPLRRGQMVTLVGDGVTVDELAHHFGTIGYEVLTSLGDRYQRVYRGGSGQHISD
jgi:alanine racemase